MGSLDDDRNALADEKPRHEVRITRPYYVGVYPVTQAQYRAAMGENPSWFSSTGGGKDKVIGRSTDQHPVESVSWLDAARFCNRLSEQEGLTAFYEIRGPDVRMPNWGGTGYRLPTEAEWEYACRGGSTASYCFGDGERELSGYAWFGGEGGSTHPVGLKRPNAWGLCDMHGNVWEWCWDWFSKDYYARSPADDPRGPVPLPAGLGPRDSGRELGRGPQGRTVGVPQPVHLADPAELRRPSRGPIPLDPMIKTRAGELDGRPRRAAEFTARRE